LAAQDKSRFLAKVTGWSRMAYFDRIFPDAVFIVLRREHRAVISSWIQAGWLDVTSELGTKTWQWGEVPDAYRQAWEDFGGGPILSAALKIQLDLDDIRKNVALLPGRCHEMQYEDLIASPLEELRAMTDACSLTWAESFEQEMRARKFYDTKNKWRKYLSEDDGELVLRFFDRIEQQQSVHSAC
jgi:hypothetical protein